ncbi:MAG: rhodanese-like domain-containing protein, partial [Rhodocyclaceae bacterium]|nr:rhodanese-like domain-containing protein [Rhodocyclaceae bacterium]
MSEKLPKGVATVAQLAEFDAVIDARSPAEFAEDHLPGAINLPWEENVSSGIVQRYRSGASIHSRFVEAGITPDK